MTRKKYNIYIERDGAGNIEKVKIPLANSGVAVKDGVDIAANYNFSSSAGKSTVSMTHSITFTDEESYYEELGFDSQLKEFAKPAWKNRLTIDQALPGDKFAINLTQRVVGPYKTRDKLGRISQHAQYDFFIRWNKALYGGDLRIGAVNALDSKPDFDTSLGSPRISGSIYPGFARYYVGYNAQF